MFLTLGEFHRQYMSGFVLNPLPRSRLLGRGPRHCLCVWRRGRGEKPAWGVLQNRGGGLQKQVGACRTGGGPGSGLFSSGARVMLPETQQKVRGESGRTGALCSTETSRGTQPCWDEREDAGLRGRGFEVWWQERGPGGPDHCSGRERLGGGEVGRGLLLSCRRMAPHPRVWFQSTFCTPPGPEVLRPH